MASGGDLDGGRELSEVEQNMPLLGRLLRRMIDGVNQLARNTASSATGDIAAPPPLSSINVSVAASGETMHVTLNHPGAVVRGGRYIVEVHTDPAFGTPVIIKDAGCSRTLEPFTLPTKNGSGETTWNYYVRGYAQNPGGQPGKIYTVGGASSPTAFTMNGSSQMDFAAPQGSGTGPNTGEGGQGLGKVQRRG